MLKPNSKKTFVKLQLKIFVSEFATDEIVQFREPCVPSFVIVQ